MASVTDISAYSVIIIMQLLYCSTFTTGQPSSSLESQPRCGRSYVQPILPKWKRPPSLPTVTPKPMRPSVGVDIEQHPPVVTQQGPPTRPQSGWPYRRGPSHPQWQHRGQRPYAPNAYPYNRYARRRPYYPGHRPVPQQRPPYPYYVQHRQHPYNPSAPYRPSWQRPAPYAQYGERYTGQYRPHYPPYPAEQGAYGRLDDTRSYIPPLRDEPIAEVELLADDLQLEYPAEDGVDWDSETASTDYDIFDNMHEIFPPQSINATDDITLENSEERIVGGNIARAHSWPWVVNIVLTLKKARYAVCGGSIVSSRFILSAAHCFTKYPDPSRYTVHIGSHTKARTEFGEQRRRVLRIISHPDYGKHRLSHDVALVELDRPVQYSRTIQPICLATRLPKAGIPCIVVGWGKTEASAHISVSGTGDNNVLQQVAVPVMRNSQCTSFYKSKFNPDAMFCAGYAEGEKDSCKGDSGGPLVCYEGGGLWNQYGVVSWGEQCAERRKPGVYTSVAVYRQWLLSVINGQQRPLVSFP